jgi:hypothetical protein
VLLAECYRQRPIRYPFRSLLFPSKLSTIERYQEQVAGVFGIGFWRLFSLCLWLNIAATWIL